MEILLNPNMAYILLVGTILLTLIAIIAPGTGAPEGGAIFCLVAGGYMAYELGVNLWAVTILALSLAPFFVALRAKAWRIPLLILTFLLLTIGSIFLFTGADGLPLVNPLLAVVVSIASGGLIWFGADRSVIAMHQAPVHNLDALVGKTGKARTPINGEGSVQVDGELWSARSEKPIEEGSTVRVLQRDGFVLIVEKTSNQIP